MTIQPTEHDITTIIKDHDYFQRTRRTVHDGFLQLRTINHLGDTYHYCEALDQAGNLIDYECVYGANTDVLAEGFRTLITRIHDEQEEARTMQAYQAGYSVAESRKPVQVFGTLNVLAPEHWWLPRWKKAWWRGYEDAMNEQKAFRTHLHLIVHPIQYYVGHQGNHTATIFVTDTHNEPTKETHGHLYKFVTGGFDTKEEALEFANKIALKVVES